MHSFFVLHTSVWNHCRTESWKKQNSYDVLLAQVFSDCHQIPIEADKVSFATAELVSDLEINNHKFFRYFSSFNAILQQSFFALEVLPEKGVQ